MELSRSQPLDVSLFELIVCNGFARLLSEWLEESVSVLGVAS